MQSDLHDIVADLRGFESRARQLSVSLVPLLRRGTAVIAGGYLDSNDSAFPAQVMAPLHRVQVMLGDAIAISGSATFDLLAALSAYPELLPAPSPDVEPIEAAVEVADVVEPVAVRKLAKRR